jgi:hypothetical protein
MAPIAELVTLHDCIVHDDFDRNVTLRIQDLAFTLEPDDAFELARRLTAAATFAAL